MYKYICVYTYIYTHTNTNTHNISYTEPAAGARPQSIPGAAAEYSHAPEQVPAHQSQAPR